MEKVIYSLWRDVRDTRAEFSRRLREEAAPRLLALGARGLQVNVCDDAVLGANTWRVATKPQMEGVVHLWVDSAISMFRKPYDEVLESVCGRFAAYLVSESNGVVNTDYRAPPGERTHGFSQCVFIVRPKSRTPEEWVEVWHNVVTPVAIECQGNFYYAANVVVRALTHAAPPYDALVEECMQPGALTDKTIFFDRGGDPEKARENAMRMAEAGALVGEPDKIDVLATSQYVFKLPGL
jgi:hypothetical protein